MWLKKNVNIVWLAKISVSSNIWCAERKNIEIKADKMSNMTFWEFLDTPHVFHNEPHMLKNK